MDILVMIILGAIAGWIASYIMRSPHGLFVDIVLGILGAMVGGFIFGLFGQSGVNGFNIYSLFVAVLGAIVVIAIHRMIVGRPYIR